MLLLSRKPRELIDVYQYASQLMGTSTQRSIVAKNHFGLGINGMFEELYSDSSVFYHAQLNGAPRLLKMPNNSPVAQLEYDVYSAAPDDHPGKQCLVEVVFVHWEFKSAAAAIQTDAGIAAASSFPSASTCATLPRHHLPSNDALLMRIFHSTLFSIRSNVAGVHKLLLNAAIRVSSAIEALHAGGYVHCDVKPGNIFVNSFSDDCFLGDYDAAVRVNRRVERTTSVYLPAEFAALRELNMLCASAALDYAMLASTLAEKFNLPVSEEEGDATVSPSSSSSTPGRLFFKLQSTRRTVPTLRSSLSAEYQRCQAAIQHTTSLDPNLVTDI